MCRTMSGQNTAGMLSIQETIPPEEAEAIRIITQSAETKLRIAGLDPVTRSLS
jgi:hypothetical protein